ncbi:MAG: hypothetical protein QM785_15790 [Pyrinomonadaceae bacterium]
MDNNEIRKLTDVVVAVRREADEKARINRTNAEMRTTETHSYLRHSDLLKRKKPRLEPAEKPNDMDH